MPTMAHFICTSSTKEKLMPLTHPAVFVGISPQLNMIEWREPTKIPYRHDENW